MQSEETTQRFQRNISRFVFGAAFVWGCVSTIAALWSSFTLGVNDTAPEVGALIFYVLSFVPASLLVFWKRRIASAWFISLAIVCLTGFTYQMHTQHEDSLQIMLRILFIAFVPPFALGIFGLITDNKSWPKLLDN